MSGFTQQRLESQLLEAISIIISRGDIKNPGFSSFVSISSISVSPDFAFARVNMTSFEDEKKLRQSVNALNSAAGYIQSKIAKLLKTRNTPKLTFYVDTSIRDGMRVNNIIDDLYDNDE
jgi:ribosome-binding factor A